MSDARNLSPCSILSTIYCPPSGWIHWMKHNRQDCSHLGHLFHFWATPRFICGFYTTQGPLRGIGADMNQKANSQTEKKVECFYCKTVKSLGEVERCNPLSSTDCNWIPLTSGWSQTEWLGCWRTSGWQDSANWAHSLKRNEKRTMVIKSFRTQKRLQEHKSVTWLRAYPTAAGTFWQTGLEWYAIQTLQLMSLNMGEQKGETHSARKMHHCLWNKTTFKKVQRKSKANQAKQNSTYLQL